MKQSIQRVKVLSLLLFGLLAILSISASSQTENGIFYTSGSFTNSIFCNLYQCGVPQKSVKKDSTIWNYQIARNKASVTIIRNRKGTITGVLATFLHVTDMYHDNNNLITNMLLDALLGNMDLYDISKECGQPGPQSDYYSGSVVDSRYRGIIARVFCTRIETPMSQNADPATFPRVILMVRLKESDEPFGGFKP